MKPRGVNPAARPLTCCLVLVALLMAGAVKAESGEVWLLVDTTALTLTVMRGEAALKTYDNIAIGSNGPTRDKQVGDEKTPRGEFRITELKLDSRFHRFLGIDYPTMEHAQRALESGLIGQAEFDAVRSARQRGEPPPQDTRLGGNLGIHGIGSGDPEIHAAFNWTNGCIALTNEQVEELLQWVVPGTRVSVR